MNAIFSIFPKFLANLSAEQLADTVKKVGLDTTNLVIRKGYWCEPDNLAKDVPVFCKTMERAGVKIHFATAGYMPEDIEADDTPLRVLAANGVREFRMGYFRGGDDPATALDDARRRMERMASLCEKLDVRAVYQVHHGTNIATATGAYYLVRDLPAERVGVMLDPGNQAHEGFEKWERSARLLGDYLVSIGVKDTKVTHDETQLDTPRKGWSTSWETVDRGQTNWHDLIGALQVIGFDGTFVWMPFYNEKEPDIQIGKIAIEVAYMRKAVAEVTGA